MLASTHTHTHTHKITLWDHSIETFNGLAVSELLSFSWMRQLDDQSLISNFIVYAVGLQGTLWSLNISAALEAVASKAKPQATFGPTTSPFALLHNFQGAPSDGAIPYGPVALAPDGSYFLGMTFNGGPENIGIIYRQETKPGGAYSILTNLTVNEGAKPQTGGLIFSADGSKAFGMLWGGGAYGNGTIFSLSLSSGATYGAITVLYNFTGEWCQDSFCSSSDDVLIIKQLTRKSKLCKPKFTHRCHDSAHIYVPLICTAISYAVIPLIATLDAVSALFFCPPHTSAPLDPTTTVLLL